MCIGKITMEMEDAEKSCVIKANTPLPSDDFLKYEQMNETNLEMKLVYLPMQYWQMGDLLHQVEATW